MARRREFGSRQYVSMRLAGQWCNKSVAVLALIGLLFGVASGQSYDSRDYNMRFIGDLQGGAGNSECKDVNDLNFAVGWADDALARRSAIYWNVSFSSAPIPLSPPGGGEDTEATSLNENLQIVGFSESAGVRRALLWPSPNLAPIDLIPGAYSAEARDIDDAGYVVGVQRTNGGTNRGWVRTPNGNVIPLLPPTSITTDESGPVTFDSTSRIEANSIASFGGQFYIAGVVYATNGVAYGCRWSSSGGANWGQPTVVPKPGAPGQYRNVELFGVTAFGHLAGAYREGPTAGGQLRAMLWHPTTGASYLGRFDAGGYSIARNIGEGGAIVGESGTNSSTAKPFVCFYNKLTGVAGQIEYINLTGQGDPLSDDQFGYFTGQARVAWSLNNFERTNQSTSTDRLPTIALTGRRSNDTRQAVLGRAIFRDNGQTGLAIGGVSVQSGAGGVPGTVVIGVGMRTNYSDNGGFSVVERRFEDSPPPESPLAPRIYFNYPIGESQANYVYAPINTGEAVGTLVNVTTTRNDAGKRVRFTPVFPGYNSALSEEVVDIPPLSTSMTLNPTTYSGDLGQAVALTANLKTDDSLQEAVAGVPVYFTISNGSVSLDTPTTLTNAQGTASILWTIDAILGVGALTVQARYDGRNSGIVFPYYRPSVSAQGTLNASSGTVLALSLPDSQNPGATAYTVRPGETVRILASLTQSIDNKPVPFTPISFTSGLNGGSGVPIGTGAVTDMNGTAWISYLVPPDFTTTEYLITGVFAGNSNYRGASDTGWLIVRLNGGSGWTLENWLISAGHGTIGQGSRSTLVIDASVGEPIAARDYQAGANTSRSSNGTLVLGHGFWEAWIRTIIKPIKWR